MKSENFYVVSKEQERTFETKVVQSLELRAKIPKSSPNC